MIAGHAILAACATPTVKETSGLEGRWRNTGGTFHLSNGRTMGPIATCRMEFSGSRSVSECVSNRGSDRIVSTYRLVAPGVLETEVIAYPAVPTVPTTTYPVKIDATWVRE